MSCPPGRRTCLGCRAVDEQSALVRVVVQSSTPDGPARLCIDPQGSLPGRGTWVHPGTACLERALKARAFARSFRRAVDTTGLEESWEHTVLLPRSTGAGDPDGI